MTVLIDTNIFLCIAGQQSKLSRRAHQAVEDRTTALWLSSVSLWEIAIKVGKGRLDLPPKSNFLRDQIAGFDIERILPVEESHVYAHFDLPRHHSDPFDRMLIAQPQVEGLPFVTCDKQIHKYPIEVIW